MSGPAFPPQVRDEAPVRPTICLDCGQTYFCVLECPSCSERSASAARGPLGEAPEIVLADDSEAAPSALAAKKRRTNPTICLECGAGFVGTLDCPNCAASGDGNEEEIAGTIEAAVLFEEMRGLGFEIR